MPLDFNLLGSAPRINTPFENLAQVLQVRNQQQAAQGLAEQRQAIADERRQKAEMARQEAQAAAQFKALLTRIDPKTGQGVMPTPEETFSLLGPENGTKFLKGLEDLTKARIENRKSSREELASVMGAILSAPEKARPWLYTNARQEVIANGTATEKDISPDYDENVVKGWLTAALSPDQIAESQKPPADYTLGNQRMSGATNQPIATAAPEPPKPPPADSFEAYLPIYLSEKRVPPQALTTGIINAARREFEAAKRAPDSAGAQPAGAQPAGVEPPLDPDSQDIIGQAGLSYNAFLAATGRMASLPRDQVTRNRATQEVQQWARSRGMDVSTLASQYKAHNEALEANILRFNRTKMAEGEIKADVENLIGAAKESGLTDVRAVNAAAQWVRGELNDPGAAQYAFFLNQLTNDIALYNAASQGRAALDADLKEAKDVVKRGIATGSLQGMQTAITKSIEKMGVVLEGGVNRARKDVWTLFGVGDKYKPTTQVGSGSKDAGAGGISYADYLKRKGGG